MKFSDPQPLWRPSEARINAANVTRFIHQASLRWGLSLPGYPELHAWSVAAPAQFWRLVWEFAEVIGEPGDGPVLVKADEITDTKWFPRARLNFAENLLRRCGSEDALIFWCENQIRRRLSFDELRDEVSSLAQALRAMGVVAGDRVAAVLPNMPEAVIAMLATSSIGAIWSSCSPDFGVRGLLDRFAQIAPKVLFCVEGYFYNGKAHDLTDKFAALLSDLPSVERLVVVNHISEEPRDFNLRVHSRACYWKEWVAHYPPKTLCFEPLPFDHPLYILFSSGTTGPPKCIVHSAGGTLLQHLKEHLLHVDIKPRQRLFYFTTCGWMMWNWLVSGLAANATLMLYDGAPLYCRGAILFDFIEQEQIQIFGTSAKYLDAISRVGFEPGCSHNLSSLETLLSTGSPLSPESFEFVYRAIKPDICLSSMSGGTDIVSCFALGSPILPVWRGELQCLGLGMKVAVFDDDGRSVQAQKGELVCTEPFPSMPIGFWQDPDDKRYHATYFERFANVWCQGDYAELTRHGGIIIYGRSDAVLNPGGVRIGTAEIYRQAERMEEVLESLVIGQQWQGDVRIILFVRLCEGVNLDERLTDKIKQTIRKNTTPHHVPAKVIQIADIPCTRSGKIVELAVRDVVHGRPVKNREALANPEALELYRDIPALNEA